MVLIENYRGWEIKFDTTRESFFIESDSFDQRREKSSYASCKAYIDDYIKNNSSFTPFLLMDNYFKLIRVCGIRKDGRFVDDKKRQLPDYFTYYEYTEDTCADMEALMELDQQRLEIDNKINEIKQSFKKVDMKELSKKYII